MAGKAGPQSPAPEKTEACTLTPAAANHRQPLLTSQPCGGHCPENPAMASSHPAIPFLDMKHPVPGPNTACPWMSSSAPARRRDTVGRALPCRLGLCTEPQLCAGLEQHGLVNFLQGRKCPPSSCPMWQPLATSNREEWDHRDLRPLRLAARGKHTLTFCS